MRVYVQQLRLRILNLLRDIFRKFSNVIRLNLSVSFFGCKDGNVSGCYHLCYFSCYSHSSSFVPFGIYRLHLC